MMDFTRPAGSPAEPAAARSLQREVAMIGSSGLADCFAGLNISLAFTTYQTNRLFLLGRGEQDGL